MGENEEKTYSNEEQLIKDSHPEFTSLLVKGKENTQANCKLCHKVIELSNMSIQAIKSHQKVVSNMSYFFKSSSAKDPPVNILSSEKISAEIMWALHCCLNGISNNSNQDTSNLFQTMFVE